MTLDHRKVGIGSTHGRGHYERALRTILDPLTDIQLTIEEVLACDEQVIAIRTLYRGTGTPWNAGDFEHASGEVLAVRDGRLARLEHYDADDRQTIIARYAELGGVIRSLGNRPPERFVAEYSRLHAARDMEAFIQLHAEDCVVLDHRKVGWEETRGREALERMYRSGIEIAPDLRHEVDEVLACDERVLATRVTWTGHAADGDGELSYAVSGVWVIEGGRLLSIDMYDYDDDAAVLARYADLGGRLETAPYERPPELAMAGAHGEELRPYEKFDQLYNERRLDELPSLYTDDYVMVDRRSMAWEEIRGPQAIADTCRSFLEQAPDLTSRCESIVPDDGGEVVLLRNTFTGHGVSAGGAQAGEVELVFIEVGLIRDGLFALTELFDEADVEAARERYEELKSGSRPLLGDTPVERVVARYLDLVRGRDIAPLVELAGDDVVVTDHRALGGPPASGPEAALGVVQSALGGQASFVTSSKRCSSGASRYSRCAARGSAQPPRARARSRSQWQSSPRSLTGGSRASTSTSATKSRRSVNAIRT